MGPGVDEAAGATAERDGDALDVADGTPVSRFAGLLERVEARGEGRTGQGPAAGDAESGEPDPLELVRRLIPEGLPPPPVDPEPLRHRGRSWRLAGGLAVLVAVALLLPGVLTAPLAVAGGTVFAPEPASYVGSEDVLYLDPSEAAYLDRVFRETTHEVAYCGYVSRDQGTPRLEVVLADTLEAGPDQIRFITDNCPDVAREVLLHTHPSGSLQLSAEDERTLFARPERFMCVQGGELPTEPGRRVTNLACYRQAGPDEAGPRVSPIPVVVTPE